jgi:hypothetical protein
VLLVWGLSFRNARSSQKSENGNHYRNESSIWKSSGIVCRFSMWSVYLILNLWFSCFYPPPPTLTARHSADWSDRVSVEFIDASANAIGSTHFFFTGILTARLVEDELESLKELAIFFVLHFRNAFKIFRRI